MRLIIATIAAACSIAVMIDTPRRELEEELRQQWHEYREHTGENAAFSATSKNLSDSLNSRLDTERYTAILQPSDARCGRRDKLSKVLRDEDCRLQQDD